MKVLHTKHLKDGRRHVLVELAPTEQGGLLFVKNDSYYKLGYPVEDIMASHVIADMQRVYWDSLEQKWIDA